MDVKANYVFEISWEVANKVGGIYTVLSTKARSMLKYIKRDNYYLIGPYIPYKSGLEFEEVQTNKFDIILKDLEEEGIIVKFGKWNIPGEPYVFLVDYRNILYSLKNHIKWELWKDYRIDSIRAGFDFDEPVVWGYAVYKLLLKLTEFLGEKKYIFHFHEWLSGSALLYLKKHFNKGIVFTTHATILGRTLASSGKDIHSIIDSYLKEKRTIEDTLAYEYNIEAKHLLEKACANNSNVFTTVSDLVAKETKVILGKEPDIITYNGINVEDTPNPNKLLEFKIKMRKWVFRFLKSYFYPFYKIQLDDKTKLLYTAGRYEYRDKGFDILIEALGLLNELIDREVFFFFFVPTSVKCEKENILRNFSMLDKMYDILDLNMDTIEESIIDYSFEYSDKLEKVDELKRMSKILKRLNKGKPPLTPFIYNYPEQTDPIISELLRKGLDNDIENKVKVIVYPIYLDGMDKLLRLDYYSAISAMDIGIFPSYYEPWGYTPLEAALYGNITITTDCSGFGRSIKDSDGVYIIQRMKRDDREVALELAELLRKLINLPAEKTMKQSIKAREVASRYDWSILIKNYIEAYNRALQ